MQGRIKTRPCDRTRMIIYLVNIMQAFFPVALVTGMILALWKSMDENRMTKQITLSIIIGLSFGSVLYELTPDRFSVAGIRTYLGIVNISAAVLTILTLWLSLKRKGIIETLAWAGSLLFVAVLSAAASFLFILFTSDQALSATSVLNTEAILNLGGILSGTGIIILLIILTVHMGRTAGSGIVLCLLTITAILLILKSGADATLGLMKAKIIELTSPRLTFVAKVTNLSFMLSYALVIVIGLLSLVSFFRRPALPYNKNMNSAEKRKALSGVLRDNRWLKAVTVTIVVVVSTMLYYDLYASRPPEISTPVRLLPNADGLIKVKIDYVKDGKLHRFSYVTDDGHIIRFFMINLYKDHTKIGVVFDACVMCGGEKGYIQKGNEVICLACNVRIFVPSIGKSGGCNPIPLKHKIQDGEIIISVKDLETEKDYFPERFPHGMNNSEVKGQDRLSRIYYGFKTAVNNFLRTKNQEEGAGKCHLNLASMKGHNS